MTRYKWLIAAGCIAICAGCSPKQEPAKETAVVRVVSLAPSLTEMVCAIAGPEVLVGRTSACDYPPEAVKNVPVIGGFGAPSLETLLKLEPTVILETDLADETLGSQMDALGLHREPIRCRTLDDIPPAIERVGLLIGYEPQAHKLASELREGLAQLRAESAAMTTRPRVYAEIWNDPMMTAGKTTFLSEVVSLAGGENIGNEVEKDFFQVDPEWVLARNPDIIFCFYMGRQGSARDTVLKRPGWQQVKAVTNGAVYDGLENNVILRPGPRMLDGIRLLRQKISPAFPK